jgi:nitroreductase
MFKTMLRKAIKESQHVQRNWDLTKTIPQEDIDIIAESITGAPSKQNIQFFKPYFVTNREKIERVHRQTSGFLIKDGTEGAKGNSLTTNPQTLAQLLIVFARDFNKEDAEKKTNISDLWEQMDRDMHQAIGVAGGYANLTSSLLGYTTGFCGCIDKNEIQRVLDIPHKPVFLLGVGIADDSKPRREHHLRANLTFPKKIKNISVEYID